MTARWPERVRTWPQYLLPQKLLTGLAHRISHSRRAGPALIRWFSRTYGVDLDEAESGNLADYPCFNAFFTRALKPGVRPLPKSPHIPVSPCDGVISQLGEISDARLIQAKGLDYSTESLLGSDELARPFSGGRFLTVYLAPADYHRVHMPLTGRLLTEMRIPGRLFSVSETSTRVIPRLFARNERMAAVFDTAHGPMAVVMVAALLVAGIETVWRPQGPYRPRRKLEWLEPERPVVLQRGDEMARFHWGSTVVVLTTSNFPRWSARLTPGAPIRLGTAISE